MHTSTVATLDPITAGRASKEPRPNGGDSRSTAIGLLVAGLATMALAAMTLVTLTGDRHGDSRPAPPAPVAATAAPSGLTIQSAGDISVLNLTYEPGQSSGWHAHAGIHAVAILSGELTVYDANCVRTTYSPDNPYVGGQQLHLIRNETDAAVPMIVTYVNPVETSRPAHVPAGTPSCPVS